MKAIEFEVELGKCYAYATMERDALTEEYRDIYMRIAQGIEDMRCAETVRAVMRLRYRKGQRFVDVARLLGVSYQWVYELHKTGVSLLKRHLSE